MSPTCAEVEAERGLQDRIDRRQQRLHHVVQQVAEAERTEHRERSAAVHWHVRTVLLHSRPMTAVTRVMQKSKARSARYHARSRWPGGPHQHSVRGHSEGPRFCASRRRGISTVNDAIRPLVETIWNYHQLHHEVTNADAILVFAATISSSPSAGLSCSSKGVRRSSSSLEGPAR